MTNIYDMELDDFIQTCMMNIKITILINANTVGIIIIEIWCARLSPHSILKAF